MNSTRHQSRRWLWFFGPLLVLAGVWLSVEWWYARSQQLTPARLAEARRLWQGLGPRDYRLEYTVKRLGSAVKEYVSEVRQDGKDVSVSTAAGRRLQLGEYPFDTMESLFDYLERQLRDDAQSAGPRRATTVVFHPRDGHLVHYVRSVRGTGERMEIIVVLTPLTAEQPQ